MRPNRKVVFVEVRHMLSTSNYYVLLLVEKQLLLWNEYLFVSDSYGIHLFRTILFNWLIHSYPLMICWDTFAFENVFKKKKREGFWYITNTAFSNIYLFSDILFVRVGHGRNPRRNRHIYTRHFYVRDLIKDTASYFPHLVCPSMTSFFIFI